MGDENSNRPHTFGDYCRPSHEGYRNAIELPEEAKVSPLRFDTIRLVQNECAFHGLSYQLADHLPAGSISTWDDLTTRFLAQFFPPRRIVKLQNDILMFQQHQDESLYNAWTRFKDLLQKVPHHGLDLWLQVQIFYDHVNSATQMVIDYPVGGRVRKLRPEVIFDEEKPWKLLRVLYGRFLDDDLAGIICFFSIIEQKPGEY
ncbi:zinc finger, CCHC-type containing protein [Tanacetum coccineum]